MTRTTREHMAIAIALTLMMSAGREAFADAVKCKEGIAKQSATYVQKRSKALQKCEDAKTKGKLPATQVCTSEPKTQSALGVLATKLELAIASACGGADKACGTADDDSLASIGWGSVATCPDFGNAGCTQSIASCSDIAICIQCSADAAVGQVIALYYASLNQAAFATGNAVNKCQQTIGNATTKFLGAKSKALQKCRNAQLAAGTATPCPDAPTTTAIGVAEQKKVAAICKACGGPDKLCDGAGDLAPSAVGFVPDCPAVTPPEPAHPSCARPIDTAGDLVACVDCVTEAAVDCLDALAVPDVNPLPAECNPTTTTTTSTTTTLGTSSTTTSTTATSTTTTSTTITATTSTTSSTLGAVCGNGVREAGEQCDDGNTTNLDGCDATCLFEQNQRVTSLALTGSPSTSCVKNVLGTSTFTSVALGQLNTAWASSVADGTISILLRMLGLDDLTGTNDAAVSVGVLSGSPVAGAGYDGTNDVDWWYTADPATIDANRIPLNTLSGSVAAKMLQAGPGRATIGLTFGGSSAPLTMFGLVVSSTNGAVSTPAVSSGTPPGHLPAEQLDPTLVSYQTSSSGTLCGNVSAASLAATPVPVTLTSGGGAPCTQGYTVGVNSLLDVVVGGCTQIIIMTVHPTQPDSFDPAAPVAGGGPPYTLVANGSHQVTLCKDKNNVAVDLTTCLQASGYSANLQFTSDRVIIK